MNTCFTKKWLLLSPIMDTKVYVNDAVRLLRDLIRVPSVSRDEARAADVLAAAIRDYGYSPRREINNVWTVAPDYDEARPTLLLNAHIDTVKPAATWTRDPVLLRWL